MLVAAVTTGAAVAAGAPTPAAAVETHTETYHQERDTFTDEVPCVGRGRITVVYNGVEHFNVNDQGFHFTFTQTGRFTARLAAGGVTSGRFTLWGGGSENASTFTFSGRVRDGVGEGTRWNSVAHMTGSEIDPRVAFERFRCH